MESILEEDYQGIRKTTVGAIQAIIGWMMCQDKCFCESVETILGASIVYIREEEYYLDE